MKATKLNQKRAKQMTPKGGSYKDVEVRNENTRRANGQFDRFNWVSKGV